MDPNLGELRSIQARTLWPLEPQFSRWLAEHLDKIAQLIGIDLELAATEVAVGPFSADIVCKAVATGKTVVIENQYGASDHDHLGKVLTYSAYQDAGVVVWIAEVFRDEHRAAIEWLNRIGDTVEPGFFAVTLGLVAIGASKPALNFSVVVEPAGWRDQRPPSQLSERARLQQAFFTKLIEQVNSRIAGLTRSTKGYPQSWFSFPAGRTGFSFPAEFLRDGRLRVGIYISTGNLDRNKAYFDILAQEKDEIEAQLGFHMDWVKREDRKDSMIWRYTDARPEDLAEKLDATIEWVVDTLAALRRVYTPRLAKLPDAAGDATEAHPDAALEDADIVVPS